MVATFLLSSLDPRQKGLSPSQLPSGTWTSRPQDVNCLQWGVGWMLMLCLSHLCVPLHPHFPDRHTTFRRAAGAKRGQEWGEQEERGGSQAVIL